MAIAYSDVFPILAELDSARVHAEVANNWQER